MVLTCRHFKTFTEYWFRSKVKETFGKGTDKVNSAYNVNHVLI